MSTKEIVEYIESRIAWLEELKYAGVASEGQKTLSIMINELTMLLNKITLNGNTKEVS